MHKMVDMLQTQTKLMSLHGNTKELEYETALATCELKLSYFVDIVATLNEGLDDELKHNEDNLYDAIDMKTNNC